MPRPRIVPTHPDLFKSERQSPTPKVPEQVNLLALVGLLLTETAAEAEADAAEDGHEDHV